MKWDYLEATHWSVEVRWTALTVSRLEVDYSGVKNAPLQAEEYRCAFDTAMWSVQNMQYNTTLS